MDVFPASRFFRLSNDGVRCDQDGLLVAGAPMLVRAPRPGGGHVWATRPADDPAGYDAHHLVQQNPINVETAPIEMQLERFGWNVIDAPSNIVWIPRVKHRLITDYYNLRDPNNPSGRRRREVIGGTDYDAQYADALSTLTLFGVLQ
jgi:hypothetical protein